MDAVADGKFYADIVIIGACVKCGVLHTGHIQMTMHCPMTPHKQHNTVPAVAMPADHSKMTLHCPDCI